MRSGRFTLQHRDGQTGAMQDITEIEIVLNEATIGPEAHHQAPSCEDRRSRRPGLGGGFPAARPWVMPSAPGCELFGNWASLPCLAVFKAVAWLSAGGSV